MGSGKFILDRFAGDMDMPQGFLAAQPIVEIAGTHRVLIENHLGVKSYGLERIDVKVKYGTVCVSGKNLEMLRMTKEQLIIRGCIASVSLQRRI